MRLTKTVVDRIEPPASGQAFHRDDVLVGFGLRVTAGGAKSFVIEKRIGGKVRRKTLGRYGALTVEQARREAQKFLGQVAQGVDPVAEARAEVARGVTLGEVFEAYVTTRKGLKPNTVFDYRRLMREAFADWRDRPMAAITKDAVSTRHRRLGERSPARANNAMRLLRALFNFAHHPCEDPDGGSLFPENPVRRLSHTRAWYPVGRRRTVITATQLRPWFEAVQALRMPEAGEYDRTVGDLLLLLLLTGLRRSEAMRLRWSDVDLEAGTVEITDTKNREPLTLPLSDYLGELLSDRARITDSEWVFPGEGESGHLVEPRPQMRKATKASGVSFTLHDLRRTFITVAESLDIPVYAIKRLVNHKLGTDVTAGYVIITVDRLRKPMQRITDAMLSHAGQRSTSTVPGLRQVR